MKLSVAFSALLSAIFFCNLTTAQDLNIVVDANVAPSRDAHFNWSFQSSGGGEVRIGQFACGSYWVAPADGDTGVTVLSLTGKTDDPNWHDFVSCDVDPLPESHGLLDGSNNYGSYNSAENILSKLPVSFAPLEGSCISLVAAMQRNESETSPAGTSQIEGEAVDAYCIVTVLPDAPDNGGSNMIRPNITGATKEMLTWDDFDLDRLPSYSFISAKSAQQWESSRIKWSHSTEIFGGFDAEISPGVFKGFSEGGRAFRSHILIPDYGAGAAKAFNDDLLALFSNGNTPAEKKAAVAAMLSYGLDLYHARFDHGNGSRKGWQSGAGQELGRFLPQVLLASLLKDETKADVLRSVAVHAHDADPALRGPQELRQIRRGVTGVVLWGDGQPFVRDGNNINQDEKGYWTNLLEASCFDTAENPCKSTNSGRAGADPYGYIDGPPIGPGGFYMSVSFGGFQGIAAAMVLMPEIRSIVNSDAPIEYVDRTVRHGIWTYPDPVAPPSSMDQNNGCDVWDSLGECGEWGITWGPDPADVRFAIEDGVGRYPSKHGVALGSGGYVSSRAGNNWSTIISLYDGDTFEDNLVPLGTLVAPEILFESGAQPKAYLNSPNYDVEIRYTIDGTEPSEFSNVYSDPIPVVFGTEIRARAYLAGNTPSAVNIRTYDFSDFPDDGEPPSIPTGLVAGNVTDTTVDLRWNPSMDNSGVAGYKVFSNGSYLFNTTEPNAKVFGLSQNTQYGFSVIAFDAFDNESAQSAEVVASTTIDLANVIPAVVSVEASDEEPNQLAVLTVDGDPVTRWATSGDPEWVQWEFDKHYNLTSVTCFLYRGNRQKYSLEIEISADGITWQNVYTGQSSGQNSSDTFEIGMSNATRFVRYIGHGGEANLWNSIAEVTFTATLVQRRWGDGIALRGGNIDTMTNLGWLYLTEGAWAWSYTLEKWIYAPDPGTHPSGAWIFITGR